MMQRILGNFLPVNLGHRDGALALPLAVANSEAPKASSFDARAIK
jgi:hypothetical protein